MFSAMGMIIARYIKEEETASSAASALTFPMMFLSGSFFPLEQMPGFLQSVAAVLPLTYVNNALRDSMIYGNTAGAIGNFLVVAVLAVAFFIVGVAVSSWKTE
jgi:ABC-2 type transport system permease protein